MTALLNCKKPEGGPPLRSQDALLGFSDQTKGVVWVIKTDTCFFGLIFCIQFIGIFTNVFLQLQLIKPSIWCGGRRVFEPVGPDGPRYFPTITTTSQKFGRLSDRNSDFIYKISKTRLFVYSIAKNSTQNTNTHT